MTDDLVARLRNEGDDEAVEALRLQEASIRRLVRKLAAAEAKEHKSFQQYVDANEARIEAEARVRELEAENKRLAERLDLLAVGFGVPDGGRHIADWQTKIEKFMAFERSIADQRVMSKYNREQAEKAERALAEARKALEPFAQIADVEDEVGREYEDDRVWVVQAYGCQIGDLTVEDFRAARRAYEGVNADG